MHCVCKELCWHIGPAEPSGLTWFDRPAVGLNGYKALGPQLWCFLPFKLEVLWLPKLADPMQFAA